jgi:hypothetical protein
MKIEQKAKEFIKNLAEQVPRELITQKLAFIGLQTSLQTLDALDAKNIEQALEHTCTALGATILINFLDEQKQEELNHGRETGTIDRDTLPFS